MTLTRGINSFVARLGLLVVLLTAAACGSNKAPVVRPTPPPPPFPASGSGSAVTERTAAPPEALNDPTVVPPEPALPNDSISSASVDDLNRTSPLKPVFFELDSAEVSPEAQRVLDANATLLRQYSTWTVTIEGHCDERGSAEYNLALGERRALAARAYLVSLGLAADRLRTVSYGKEFPFDPGHNEAAWTKNRRAHFVVTSK
jgi:peptidoglycan-associated lipoprotein